MGANEKVRKLAEEALTHLAADLEKGHSEVLKNYLAAMSRFRRYSWGNVLLISSQRPNATQVAGFHTWHQLGRSVRKGEKGIMIFAPMVVKQPPVPDTRPEPSVKEPFRLAGFRPAHVFDVAQTEGKPLPQFAQTAGDPKDYTDKLKGLLTKQGINLEYDKTIAPALGVSSGGRIRLQPDLAPAEEFATLAHELAHEMLHKSPEARALPKVVRETQAEAVAFVVCRTIGLDTNTAAADYIKLYNGDQKTLAASLATIQSTSAEILDEILPKERPAPSPVAETRETVPPYPESSRSPRTSESGPPQSPTQVLEPLTWNR